MSLEAHPPAAAPADFIAVGTQRPEARHAEHQDDSTGEPASLLREKAGPCILARLTLRFCRSGSLAAAPEEAASAAAISSVPDGRSFSRRE